MPAIPAAVCTAGTHKGLLCDWCEHLVHAHSHVVEDDPVFTGASQCGTAIHKRNSRTHKRLAQSQLQLACCAFHMLTARWSTPAREWRPPAARPAYALLTAWRTAAEVKLHVYQLSRQRSLLLSPAASSNGGHQMPPHSHAFVVTNPLLVHNTWKSLPCIAASTAACDRLTFSWCSCGGRSYVGKL